MLLNMFKNMWNNFYNVFIRAVDPVTRMYIIMGIFLLALITFILSIRKKDSIIISNWFLFYLSIAITVIGVVYTSLW